MANKDEVIGSLRATLNSCKGAVTLKQCNRDYRELEGEYIPYAKLGYRTLEEFVNDIPLIKLKKDYNGEIIIDVIPTENTKHIADMVARQKSVSRRSAPKANYSPRPLRSDSWRKPSPFNNGYKSQFYKQYKPQKYNNNSTYSNDNQYSKSQPHKTPEPARKVTVVTTSAPVSTPAPAPAVTVKTSPPAATKKKTVTAVNSSNVVKAAKPEKKYSLTARLEAAVLADDSEPIMSSKHSRASSRLSNFRDSLHTVDRIPLPLPAAVNPTVHPAPQVEAPPPPPPRSPTPPPPDATSQERLAWLCKRYELPEPVYKIISHKESKKGPTCYYCNVKIGNENSATTYPDGTGSEAAARELAAARLVLEVEVRCGGGGGAHAVTSPAVALERLAELVQRHPSGVWAATLPQLYRREYNETLPSNWQELVESSNNFNKDQGVNGQLMVLPVDPDNEASWPQRVESPLQPAITLPELKLPDEASWNVYVTTVNSTVEVWLRLIGEQYSTAYHNLLTDMETYYSTEGVFVTAVEVNSWYAVSLEEGWHRGLVLELDGAGSALVFLGDHGDDELVPVSRLRLLAPRFAYLPPQAILCRLDKMEELAASDFGVDVVQQQLVDEVFVAVPAAPAPAPAPAADHSVAVVLYRTSDSDNELNMNDQILKEVCQLGEMNIASWHRWCEVEVGCVSVEGHVWVARPDGARLVREALALLTAPGPYHRPLPVLAAPEPPHSNTLYVVRTLTGTWLRCSVRTGVSADGTVSTRLVDSGLTMRAPLSALVPLHSYSRVLALFPPQARSVRLGAAARAAPAMVERLRELLLDKAVLCRALSVPAVPAAAEPDVELCVRPQGPHGVLASVNSTIIFEFEERQTQEKQKEVPKKNPLEALSRKKERIFSRAVSGGRLADSQPSSALPALELPRLGQWVNVLVTMAANPCNFVVQLCEARERQRLSEMMAQLQAECAAAPPAPPPAPGDLYTLLYTDNSWYRVVVANVVSPQMVSVYFCDFGDLALVSAEQLRRVPDAVPLARTLPPQAVKAKLYGVAPLHQDWSVEDCLRFQELTVNQEFAALIRDMGSDPLHAGEPLLTLDLVNTDTSEDVYVNQQLEAERRAKLTAAADHSLPN